MLSDDYIGMAEKASAKLYAKHYYRLKALEKDGDRSELRYEEGFVEALDMMFSLFFTGRSVFLIKELAKSVYEEMKGEA